MPWITAGTGCAAPDAAMTAAPDTPAPRANRGHRTMTEDTTPPADRPATAEEWLVLLQDRPDDTALHADHRRWLAADPANADAWREAQRVWALLGAPEGAAVVTRAAVGATPLRRPLEAPPRRWPRMAAAVAALAACVALVVLIGGGSLTLADVATGVGETRRILLADGSAAVLAPQTALDVAVDADGRRVTLRRGTAFFEVKPNPDHPFTVLADGVQTTVLGTAFEVGRAGDAVRVAVEHGRVRVDDTGDAAAAVTLSAGQAVRVGAAGIGAAETLPPALVATWRGGRLAVRDEPVGAVIDQLAPYFAGWIVVADEALARQTVTGLYDLSDATAAVEAVADAHGAVVYRISPWLLVLRGGGEDG